MSGDPGQTRPTNQGVNPGCCLPIVMSRSLATRNTIAFSIQLHSQGRDRRA